MQARPVYDTQCLPKLLLAASRLLAASGDVPWTLWIRPTPRRLRHSGHCSCPPWDWTVNWSSLHGSRSHQATPSVWYFAYATFCSSSDIYRITIVPPPRVAKLGRCLPVVGPGRHSTDIRRSRGPSLARAGPHLAQLSGPKSGPKPAKNWSSSANICRSQGKLGRSRAAFDRCRPRLGRVRACLNQRMQAKSGETLCQI